MFFLLVFPCISSMGLEKFLIFWVSGLQENKSRSFCYANGRYISSQSTFSFSSISFQKADADPEFQERGDPLQIFLWFRFYNHCSISTVFL